MLGRPNQAQEWRNAVDAVVMVCPDDIQAEFDGNKAKLRWLVSIDGKKFESETYKILAVLDK
jgi:hypothetical protein